MQTIGGREPLHGELGRLYDAIENPRRTRGDLPILRDAELRSYLADVRERSLEVLEEVDLAPDAEDPLLREGFVYEMLIAHELQHNETMLQLLQMVDGYEHARRPPHRRRGGAGTIAIEGGEYEIGAHDRGFAYDNERPRHSVELAPFEIDEVAGHERRVRPLHRGDRNRAAPLLGARRGRLGRHRDGPPGADRPRPAGDPRLLARGRCLRPLGRQAPAHGAGVGGGLAAPTGHRPGLGMDVLRFPRLPGLRSVPLPRVLRRPSSATSTGCFAAAPGRPIPMSCGPAFATGTCPGAGRSSPACAAQGT